MPQLSLVPADVVESWDDAEIRWFYREARRLGVPAPTSLALESHDPAGMLGFCRLWWASFHEGRIERTLMEEVRVRIAEQAGCAYCAMSHLHLPDEPPGAPGVAGGVARRAAALAFTDLLALRPWEMGPHGWDALRVAFDEGEVVELAVFAAWQYSGPRMLRSWGAGRFKQGARAELARLPVALAYADEPAFATPTARPRNTRLHPDDATSAPLGWLAFLEPRPDLAAAWTGLWRSAIDDGQLPARIGQLIRVDLAARLAHPAWAPHDNPGIRAAGIDAATVAALQGLDVVRFDDRERAAVGYARAMMGDRDLDETEEAILAALFNEAELVGLGLATAVQIGAILVDRSRVARTVGPITMLSGADG